MNSWEECFHGQLIFCDILATSNEKMLLLIVTRNTSDIGSQPNTGC